MAVIINNTLPGVYAELLPERAEPIIRLTKEKEEELRWITVREEHKVPVLFGLITLTDYTYRKEKLSWYDYCKRKEEYINAARTLLFKPKEG